MKGAVWDDTRCSLGEGPLWHPGRDQLFWFDIDQRQLHTREGDAHRTIQFDEQVSAAGWIDEARLLVASETRLMAVDVDSGGREDVCPLEADDPATRSNDGRADPWGGFWIGTMGKSAEPGAGAIYRWYLGELRRLHASITISNAICFSPDKRFAYFTDTPTGIVQRQPLDPGDGWPAGEAEPWLDLRDEGWNPDGAMTDAEGNFWNAQWGGWRVACYAPDGRFVRAVTCGASNVTCPAFGGPDLTTLFCTSALSGVSEQNLAQGTAHGATFAAAGAGIGRPEPRVIL